MLKPFVYAIAFLIGSIVHSAAYSATIAVVGRGVVKADPDLATISFMVNGVEKDAASARVANARVTQKLKSALLDIGIQEKDFFTSFSNFMRREQLDGRKAAYTVSNTITIKTTKFDLLPKIFSLAIDNGATFFGQVNYSVTDEKSFIEKARAIAYQQAKDEAEKSASSLNLKLGKVSKVSVGAASFSNIFGAEMMLGGGRAALPMIDAGVEVKPVEFEYVVTVEYDLE
jgi:uncharacterized protein